MYTVLVVYTILHSFKSIDGLVSNNSEAMFNFQLAETDVM